MDIAADPRSDGYEQLRRAKRHESQVQKILGCLNEREREIILQRFGLRGGSQGLTLKEVGVGFGVSKERIRQIEAKAMDKLRATAVKEKLDAF